MVFDHLQVLARGAVDHEDADADDERQHAGQRPVQTQRAQGAAARGQRAARARGREFIVNHGFSCDRAFSGSKKASNILRAIGAAVLPPCLPFSTKTATASLGSSAGANEINRAWSSIRSDSCFSLYFSFCPMVKTCADPVLPAIL